MQYLWHLIIVTIIFSLRSGNKPCEILIIPFITTKGKSTTTESHRNVDPAVRNLKFIKLMRTGGEINQNGKEFRFPVLLRMEFPTLMGKSYCNFENIYFWRPTDKNN